MIFRTLPLAITSIFLLGCTENRIARNLSAHLASQERDAAWLDSRMDSAPSVPIKWSAALAKMRSSNLGLLQSRAQMEEAQKQPRREWLGLLPRLSGFVSLGDSISQLTDIGSNLDARLVANFAIPNPVEFYATIYGAQLQKQGAIWSNQLDERRAYIQLYTVYAEAASIQDAAQRLTETQKSLSVIPLEELEKVSKGFLSSREQLRIRQKYHRLAVNRLFNTPGANWKLVGSVPSLGYEKSYRNIKLGNNFGKLAFNLQAVQIEAAQMSVYRVRYRQWPSINFGLSTPSLYSTQDTNSGYSSDNTYLFSSASQTVDYTDLGGFRSVKDARQRLENTRAQIRLRMEEETVRMKELCRAYSNLLIERNMLEKQLAYVPRSASTDYQVLSQQLLVREEHKTRLAEIKNQLTQLDLQLLIWDENYWKN